MSRSVPEWIGKSDDTPVPPRVKARIFLAHGGRCHLSGRIIRVSDAWDLDHVVALCNGGLNVESNLAPALRDKHREKTAVDVAERSKVDRVRAKHLGTWPKSKAKLGNRGFSRSRPLPRDDDALEQANGR